MPLHQHISTDFAICAFSLVRTEVKLCSYYRQRGSYWSAVVCPCQSKHRHVSFIYTEANSLTAMKCPRTKSCMRIQCEGKAWEQGHTDRSSQVSGISQSTSKWSPYLWLLQRLQDTDLGCPRFRCHPVEPLLTNVTTTASIMLIVLQGSMLHLHSRMF